MRKTSRWKIYNKPRKSLKIYKEEKRKEKIIPKKFKLRLKLQGEAKKAIKNPERDFFFFF